MNKIVKYTIGAGALFLAGAASCYLLTGDVKGLWDKTKYVARKTQMAIVEYDEKVNEKIIPEPVQAINEGIVRTFHGMTQEEVEQKREEFKSDLDFKIKQYEKDKK